MTYRQRLSLFIIIDSVIILAAIYVSSYLVSFPDDQWTVPAMPVFAMAIILGHHFFAVLFKLYKKVWEYASVGELILIIKVATYSILSAGIVQYAFFTEIHAKLLLATWLIHMLAIGGSRFIWRLYRDTVMNKADRKVRTLIVGAGSAGTMVARQLLKKNEGNLLPIAFIDDDKRKHHLDILGLPVMGGVKEIAGTVEKMNIDNIIISIPSLSGKELNLIYQECAKTKAKTKILPLLEDLITGKIAVSQFRDVQVEDLLGREPVHLDMEKIRKSITGKIIMVTGAGGSIGSEIARQIARFQPSRLILLGHGENSIYTIDLELKEMFPDRNFDLVAEIADVKDAQKMMHVVHTYKPDVIYHAAAHKHVPLMEKNPEEAVKNNIIGTKNIAMAAKRHHVKTFVMISTDKAVNPTSVMGASKRIAEMIIQDLGKSSKTKFVAVRFGNVLGSRGSVIPLFKKQIERGGPVTVTHPDMIRYFMTIPEASRLVIQAGALANGGEIFVLDMGEPVKIVDLAKNLITLSGYTLEEIGIAFTGIRPGEKLFEELLNKNEVHEKQVYPKIYIGKTTDLYMKDIDRIITTYMFMDHQALRKELLELANNKAVHDERSIVSI